MYLNTRLRERAKIHKWIFKGADADAAAEFVAKHPERSDLRVVVGVLRDGARHGLARVVTAPDDLLGSEDLVPGLAEALLATFREEDS